MSRMGSWSTGVELVTALDEGRKEMEALLREHENRSGDAAEMIAHIYSFIGESDAFSNDRSAVMLRHHAMAMESLRTAVTGLSNMQQLLKTAYRAVDEAEAKRKSARSKLDV